METLENLPPPKGVDLESCLAQRAIAHGYHKKV